MRLISLLRKRKRISRDYPMAFYKDTGLIKKQKVN